MAGHWGNEPIRVQSILVLDVLPDHNAILVKGSIPGPNGGIVFVEKSRIANRKSQRLKLNRIKPMVDNLLKEVAKDESA